jgi:hypothetical protein
MAAGAFDWQQIDHEQVRLKLDALAKTMRDEIQAEVKRLRSACRRNRDAAGFPTYFSRLLIVLTGKWAEKTFAIYRDIWEKQGNVMTPSVVLAVAQRVIRPLIQTRKVAATSEFRRMGLPYHEARELQDRFMHLDEEWKRRLEIEAAKCDYRPRSEAQPTQLAATRELKTRKPPLARYRSELKRAIATALTKNPTATDLQVCRSIDNDGSAELAGADRTLEAALRNKPSRPRLESTISKVRRDLREDGLL